MRSFKEDMRELRESGGRELDANDRAGPAIVEEMFLVSFDEEPLHAFHGQEEEPPVVTLENEVTGPLAMIEPERDQGEGWSR